MNATLPRACDAAAPSAHACALLLLLLLLAMAEVVRQRTKRRKVQRGADADANDDDGTERPVNACVVCGVDMGPGNPRQYCRKTFCGARLQYRDLVGDRDDEAKAIYQLDQRLQAHAAAVRERRHGDDSGRLSRAEVARVHYVMDSARCAMAQAERAIRAHLRAYPVLVETLRADPSVHHGWGGWKSSVLLQ
jgi:hypothetical protein